MPRIIEPLPIDNYPIDRIPLTENGLVGINESTMQQLNLLGIACNLLIGYGKYQELNEITCNSAFLEPIVSDWKGSLFFLANTGYSPIIFSFDDSVSKLMLDQPDIAITELDKAILGCIHMFYVGASLIERNQNDADPNALLYSFISILHSVQNYELKTKKTIRICESLNESYVFNALADIMPSENDSDLVSVSDDELELLHSAIEYRKTLATQILETRRSEKEFSNDPQNNLFWEKYLSFVEYLVNEQQRVFDLIHDDCSPRIKQREFETYTNRIINQEFPDDELEVSFSELTKKINERYLYANDYFWVKTANGGIHKMLMPAEIVLKLAFSYNHVLIAYHAFLIDPSANNLSSLTFILNGFIRRNLDENTDVFGDLNSAEDLIVSISDLIFDFYEEHSSVVDSLRFDRIQLEETLSGLDFHEDILNQLFIKELRMINENTVAFDNLTNEKKNDLIESAISHFIDLSDERLKDEYIDKVRKYLPHSFDNEHVMYEEEIATRLIVCINAIYILRKTIEIMIDKRYIHNYMEDRIRHIGKKLTGLEIKLIQNTYVVIDYRCYDDINMEEYRKLKGIDASDIVSMNMESTYLELFKLVRQKIQEIHNQIENLDMYKASQFKGELRKELLKYPKCEMKDDLVDLIDQECSFICNSLIKTASADVEFSNKKKELMIIIGHDSNKLPTETIDALTTAELLYSQYATPKYSSVGFDYSCISALYYQAVEAMYNKLLWRNYAKMLNQKTSSNGIPFVDLFKDRKLKTYTECQGYLPEKMTNVLNKSKTQVLLSLTMGSFEYILYNLTSQSKYSLPFFEQHFYSVFGYSSVKNGPELLSFKSKIDELYLRIKNATPNRNAASHGENIIDLTTCQSDKEAVLSNAKNIRNNIIGLIQFYLSMYR